MGLPLGERFQERLATATDEVLQVAAAQWVLAEEFGGDMDVDDCLSTVHELAELVKANRPNGYSLYCWICL